MTETQIKTKLLGGIEQKKQKTKKQCKTGKNLTCMHDVIFLSFSFYDECNLIIGGGGGH